MHTEHSAADDKNEMNRNTTCTFSGMVPVLQILPDAKRSGQLPLEIGIDAIAVVSAGEQVPQTVVEKEFDGRDRCSPEFGLGSRDDCC